MANYFTCMFAGVEKLKFSLSVSGGQSTSYKAIVLVRNRQKLLPR